MVADFRGVGVALITPFNNDFSIDYPALKKLITHVSDDVDFLVVNGTTGEASTLSDQEKLDVLKFIGENNEKNLPIMYGIGANNTQHILDIINETPFDHVDSILTVAPYYNKPSQAGVIKHYELIANISPKPICLYNIPGRCGINLSSDTIIELAHHDNISGIKEASGNLEQAMELVKRKPNDFNLLSGDDLLTTPMISFGFEGVISVQANLFPKLFSDCIHLALKGDFKTSADILIQKLFSINSSLYKESNPVGAKAVLEQIGICGASVRLPLIEASEELKKELKSELVNIL